MNGRIEKKVFSDYSNAKELIEKTNFFGVFIDKKRNLLIKLQGRREDVILVSEKSINMEYGIFGFIDCYEPDELLLFEDLKEATDWLYEV